MNKLRKDAGALFMFNQNIISVKFLSRYSILVGCCHEIEFFVQATGTGYRLYELDENAIYFLADNLVTIADVYERMCKEHGCLR